MKKMREEAAIRLIEAEEDLLIDAHFLIEEIMRQKGIDRTTLAKAMGLSRPRLSQLLGPDANPTVKTLGRIFAALGEEISFARKSEIAAGRRVRAMSSWGVGNLSLDGAQSGTDSDWATVEFGCNDNPAPFGELEMAA
jgi:DNA-binding phage protein